MVNKNYYARLKIWKDFRETLEHSDFPYEDAVKFFDCLPTSNIAADPYDDKTWPGPWTLIQENDYCRFTKTLGICYSLQLTERFSHSQFEIHIGIDKEINDLVYTISIDNDSIVSYNDNWLVNTHKDIDIQSVIAMPKIN